MKISLGGTLGGVIIEYLTPNDYERYTLEIMKRCLYIITLADDDIQPVLKMYAAPELIKVSILNGDLEGYDKGFEFMGESLNERLKNDIKDKISVSILEAGEILDDLDIVKESICIFQSKTRQDFYTLFIGKLGKYFAKCIEKGDVELLKNYIEIAGELHYRDFYHIIWCIVDRLRDPHAGSKELTPMISMIIGNLKNKGIEQEDFSNLENIIECLCDINVPLSKKYAKSLLELCNKIMIAEYRFNALLNVCKLFNKLDDKKQVDNILEEAELLIRAPVLVDKRLLTRFEHQKRRQVDMNTLIDVAIGKTKIIDATFNEHDETEHFDEISQDDLQPILEISQEAVEMDVAERLIYIGNKCWAFDRKDKGNEFIANGLSKLKNLPSEEEKAKYLLSFAENIYDPNNNSLVYTLVNKAINIIENATNIYYVRNEKINSLLWEISRSLSNISTKLNDKNFLKKSNEILMKIDETELARGLNYKSINDLILSKEYSKAKKKISESQKYLETLISKHMYQHLLVNLCICKLKLGYMLQDSKYIDDALSTLEDFFMRFKEPFNGTPELRIIITYLSEDGLFFTKEIIQSLVEIACSHFDELGTVTCLAKLASALAHGGTWKGPR